MKLKLLAATALLSASLTPALADAASLPTLSQAQTQSEIDSVLSRSEREAYRQIFADIRNRNWESAEGRLARAPDSVLHPVARAELYLAPGSPRVELEPLRALLNDAPDLPDANRILTLAQSRGLEQAPVLPRTHSMRRPSGPSRRARAQPVRDDSAARSVVREIRPLIVADSPREAENVLERNRESLTRAGLTEVQQRVSWSYYLTGDDRNAQRLARQARAGIGDWAVHGDWVDGLASWRLGDFEAAADAFASVGRRAPDSEKRAAGLYWAARAEMRAGRPENVQTLLRTAALMDETFYGLLAMQSLGISEAPAHRNIPSPTWDTVASFSTAQRAMALAELGERELADEFVRHGAAIGNPQHHDAWLDLANQLRLPNAELWIARNAPVSYHASSRVRFPAPGYEPVGGWRVDRSLVYAHALQESNFRPEVVSPAGARGLLQLMPGTARDIARDRGETVNASRLNVPEINIEYGQHYMEEMRDFSGMQGLLPKVIASYNAGPGAVMNWEGRLRDRGDPLLYIESIPFYETRGYVPIVLRNYWMYQRNAGEESTSLAALAQGMWPRFPGAPGAVAVRLSGQGGARIAN
ncbi:lytic transglycosylase domain-containing protein [Parasphingopyxis sp.]|uniref:lytic transglycosylase domain-containing protein n=1 Tax=Parasphingopyxis sp. TaxID=1920299 RepID=UPI00261387E2|nr:lytic transglycosylase domain-containing protein [Parasphingopyxis sp.]